MSVGVLEVREVYAEYQPYLILYSTCRGALDYKDGTVQMRVSDPLLFKDYADSAAAFSPSLAPR